MSSKNKIRGTSLSNSSQRELALKAAKVAFGAATAKVVSAAATPPKRKAAVGPMQSGISVRKASGESQSPRPNGKARRNDALEIVKLQFDHIGYVRCIEPNCRETFANIEDVFEHIVFPNSGVSRVRSCVLCAGDDKHEFDKPYDLWRHLEKHLPSVLERPDPSNPIGPNIDPSTSRNIEEVIARVIWKRQQKIHWYIPYAADMARFLASKYNGSSGGISQY